MQQYAGIIKPLHNLPAIKICPRDSIKLLSFSHRNIQIQTCHYQASQFNESKYGTSRTAEDRQRLAKILSNMITRHNIKVGFRGNDK